LIKKALKKTSKVDFDEIYKNQDSVKKFKDAIYSYAYINRNKTGAFLTAYHNKLVKPIRILQSNLSKDCPIFICAAKNELTKIKLQVEYHRKIGVRHFAYVDNMSEDGSIEWLMEQPDVSLFSVDESYNSNSRNAWRRQITDYFGYNKWYLILDADELFIYPGIEKIDINQYINFLEKKKINSAFSPMIDMYSKNKLFEGNDRQSGILSEYCFFDTDTYKNEKELIRQCVTGGPRMRLFGESNTNSKYALIKLSEEMLVGTHENHPYKLNYKTNGAIAFLLHYKFLPSDKNKYRENITSGLYGSAFMYQKYMDTFDQNPDTLLYYDGAEKLTNSMDLLKISLIDKKFFKQFLKNAESK